MKQNNILEITFSKNMISRIFKLNIKIPIFPTLIIYSITLFSLIILYSIGSGKFFPWCFNQFCKLILGSMALIFAASIKITFWRKYAYIFYVVSLILLVCVAIIGKISMGAQRWISFYFFNFQPSELMRIGVVLVMAKYFSTYHIDEIRKTRTLFIPFVLVIIPVCLVLLQPDLGTAMLLLFVFASILFICGVQIRKFVVAIISVAISTPTLWNLLHEYQRQRILMFLSPEMDPSGAGYHIIQSKIAIGSGGIWGKGLFNGSQSQLSFLPEKQTDFVFAALAEELGFFGCLFLLILYFLLISYNIQVALNARNKFNQVLAFGLTVMFFFYIFINIAMVCGLLPVVGIPLPFFSYGGSALIVLMFCQGLIFAIDLEEKSKFGIRYN